MLLLVICNLILYIYIYTSLSLYISLYIYIYVCMYVYIYIYIYIYRTTSVKRATSVPAEGPAYGLDLARHCELPLRAQKWLVRGIRTFGAA